jgi:hypothetical protein
VWDVTRSALEKYCRQNVYSVEPPQSEWHGKEEVLEHLRRLFEAADSSIEGNWQFLPPHEFPLTHTLFYGSSFQAAKQGTSKGIGSKFKSVFRSIAEKG